MKHITFLVLLSFAACTTDNSKHSVNRDTLTQRQKDSILAKSTIPGARSVGSALRAADSVSSRTSRIDSVARDSTQF